MVRSVPVINYVSVVCLFSPSEVRLVWLRHNLARFKDWLRALEEKMAKENLILTEAQVQALEKKKDDDIALGEIETPPRLVILVLRTPSIWVR